MERNNPRPRRNRGVERLKSVLIVLLSCSAVYLTARALVPGQDAAHPQGLLSGLSALLHPQGAVSTPAADSTVQLTAAAQPVRIAVCDGANRYAVQYNTAQVDKLYDNVGILLGEALASAKAPAPISEERYQLALQSPGVWFDFLGKIPLDTLSAWTGEGSANRALSGSARQIAVALVDGGVGLYYHNESDGQFYACETGVVYADHMDRLLADYGGNSVFFAFEQEEDSGYAALGPYVLLGPAAPTPAVYRVSNPLVSLDEALIAELQQALAFQTSYYPIPNGIRIREGQETLEISSSGAVSYSMAEDTGASRYPVGGSAGGDTTELIETTRRMVTDTVGRYCAAARLYLTDIQQTDTGVEVYYGYSLNGAEVSLPGGNCAAKFTVEQGQIVSFTLFFRRYEDSGQTGLVPQERLAAAALEALAPEGRELALCYSDTGGDTVSAGWVAK